MKCTPIASRPIHNVGRTTNCTGINNKDLSLRYNALVARYHLEGKKPIDSAPVPKKEQCQYFIKHAFHFNLVRELIKNSNDIKMEEAVMDNAYPELLRKLNSKRGFQNGVITIDKEDFRQPTVPLGVSSAADNVAPAKTTPAQKAPKAKRKRAKKKCHHALYPLVKIFFEDKGITDFLAQNKKHSWLNTSGIADKFGQMAASVECQGGSCQCVKVYATKKKFMEKVSRCPGRRRRKNKLQNIL